MSTGGRQLATGGGIISVLGLVIGLLAWLFPVGASGGDSTGGTSGGTASSSSSSGVSGASSGGDNTSGETTGGDSTTSGSDTGSTSEGASTTGEDGGTDSGGTAPEVVLSDDFLGDWTGQTTQPSSGASYYVALSVQQPEPGDTFVGSFLFTAQTGSCEGSLHLYDHSAEHVTMTAQLTSGIRNCYPEGTIRIVYQAPRKLAYFYYLPGTSTPENRGWLGD
jgi:hypothetical protein